MPELLNRLEDASVYPPGMKLRAKVKIEKKFNTESMVGVLKNWFPKKSSVEIIRELREGEEL
ncbi:MAG TPA: hypothetical protein ENG12_01165 [Candidatus Altiarchaeales archaeon]|nr:hypothetical protein [Candidatus Altiarchaeales archaeon]